MLISFTKKCVFIWIAITNESMSFSMHNVGYTYTFAFIVVKAETV